MPWPFTRKNNKNRRNLNKKTNKNLRNMAASRAYWNVKAKYGRAGQSRVANVFSPPNAIKHNIVASEQQLKAEEYFNEMKEAASKITPVQVNQMREFGEDLRQQIEEAETSGRPSISINIPLALARLLQVAVGIFLMAAALTFGVFFTVIIAAISGSPSLIVADMLVTAWAYITGRPEEPNAAANANEAIRVNNPMRRGANV